MYSVNAPAVDCDFQSGIRPDNANQQQPVMGQESNEDVGFQFCSENEGTIVDPSEIAAKILQMHNASEEESKTASPRPKLIETEEDASFEMPGVLLRPRKVPLHESSKPMPEFRSKDTLTFINVNGGGPSFKALFLSTVLIAGVGGGALALGMSGAFQEEDIGGRLVQTELITPTPTIESLIEADTRSLNNVQVPDASTSKLVSTSKATENQVSVAKQRIRNAFSAGNTGQAVTSRNSVQAGQSGNIAVSEIRAKPVPTASSHSERVIDRGTGSQPLFASASGELPIPGSLAGERASTSVGGEDPSRPSSASAVPEGQSPTQADVSPPVDPSFPNAGRTLASVNMRQSEDKDATIIAVIPESTEVRFDECGKWWCGVSYEGQSGYVGQKYLERSVQKVE